MTKKIVNHNRISSQLWGPLTSPNPPTGWWPPAWDEYVRSGDWGAVIVSNGSVFQGKTLSVEIDLEAHVKAVLPLHVEESKNLSALPRERLGDSFDMIMKGKVPAAVDWLNAEGEAFLKEPKAGFYFRIRRIRGRRSGGTSGDTSLRSSFVSVA